MNRLYGWRNNPLYHSGAIAVALFVVLLVTGVYLIFVYRLSAPYESVAWLGRQPWLGGWIRTLHRYASDAAVIAVVIHAFRMFAQNRTWGPRALAWVSGVLLLGVVMVCGWTGYVMVWDVQAQVLAQAGARLFDALPIFSEPISAAFVGERPLPDAFFFLNLFLHLAVPIGLGLMLWLHVSRLARPGLLPPRGLMWGGVALLTALSVIWPAPLGPPADLLRLPERAPFDFLYAFWVPLAQAWPAWVFWAITLAAGGAALLVPWWAKPAPDKRPPPSFVDERLCTGCEQCYVDCPYEAIDMRARQDARPTLVAHVDPQRCVSCGICAGSCAPMGVGPAGRTGRDQLRVVERFVAEHRPAAADVVLIACDRVLPLGGVPGATLYPVSCAGSLHTSVVEYFTRKGVGGVLIAACAPRDCWNREGPKWLEQRLYHDREAELQERVDRRRVRLVYASAGSAAIDLDAAVRAFRADLAALERPEGEAEVDLVNVCETDESGPA